MDGYVWWGDEADVIGKGKMNRRTVGIGSGVWASGGAQKEPLKV